MAIKVAINHRTSYKYDRLIKAWPQVIKLRPAPHCRTPIISYALNIEPKNHFINWMQDPFGNYQARIVFPEKIDHLIIDVDVVAELVTINPFDFFLEESAETFPFEYDLSLKTDLQPYLMLTEEGPLLQTLFDDCQQYLERNTVDFLVAINQHIYRLLQYQIRMEPGVQSCEVTLVRSIGSCRDFAWLLVLLFRRFGLAARFVSGYLVQLKPDVVNLDGPNGPQKDFTDLHAWTEVFVPGAGWVGLDSTSGLFAGEGHIPLACTPMASSAAPIIGAIEPAETVFDFNNTVHRIDEQPRVTKPYRDDQWQGIKNLGYQVDHLLVKNNIPLTMGGEPTFISTEDMESNQWNTAADGADKRILAYQLANELKAKFGSQGMIHCGQGKWYPGEPIPRWQYAIYWRRDGESIWSTDVSANPNEVGEIDWQKAQGFSKELEAALGLPSESFFKAYEDEYYYRWEEANLPVDGIQDIEEMTLAQQKLSELLDKGIDKPVGLILPLQFDLVSTCWQTSVWQTSRERLFLIPGNSQLGYRLPLDRLQTQADRISGVRVPPNHFESSEQLPSAEHIRELIQNRSSKEVKEHHSISNDVIRTALCIELIDGRLHVFVPPVDEAHQYLDLMTSIEQAALRSRVSVVIDGYQAPYSPELIKLAVTPDPGVIEVNIHPAKSWQEILDNYQTLFDAVKKCKLGTNKYMLDGNHTGTGGGNHITLGGSTPAESPFLNRPDLLRSMLTFWQNHPSLSYLFASTFIGTTSQSPRLDEGRSDILAELEIAFAELENLGKPGFWQVDRILRNFLTDITGNTHRAEFCIDKLYSPDSMSGRLGIVELRAFDMPPHQEMCIVQLLLIRALVAAFAQNPYKSKLRDWGVDLHSRFMIHHYVREDIIEVVDYLNQNGIPFSREWLDIFLEFRFPRIGSVDIQGVELSLRSGLEPWRVLGEEMNSSATAR